MKVMFPWFQRWEAFAIRRALAIVPVCDALAEIGHRAGARKIFILRDISLLEQGEPLPAENLRESLSLRGVCFMYIGNLEVYQGIDLLLDSFAILQKGGEEASLVIVGGAFRDIQFYQEKTRRLGIEKNVHFLGPRPVNQMGALIRNADVLVSPRIKGRNTPMKIYSYLDSGRPILATDLFTHTQVLTPDVAVLEPPVPERFAEGMRSLIKDPELRSALARKAQNLAREKYCLTVYRKTAGDLYDYIESQIAVKERQPPVSK
jgi:glycosyltransferase involved in cell wall biosynthesis